MADTDEPPPPAAHLLTVPDPDLWTSRVFFGRFREVLRPVTSLEAANAALDEVFKNGPARAVARQVIARAGGGLNPTANLVVVGAFTEMKNSDAVETVALAHLGEAEVDHHRTKTTIRRHALMALLFEHSPDNMVDLYLWDRHCTRRRPRFRLPKGSVGPAGLSLPEWAAAAEAVLLERKEQPTSGFATYDKVLVAPGAGADEVLVALREWPGRSTGRAPTGEVLTVRTPDWTCLHFFNGGLCVEVSDSQANRGPDFASHLVSHILGEPCQFELVLEPLSDDVLNDFVAKVTDPHNDDFPLVELVAEVPWRPHRALTVTGTRTSTAEDVVQDLRVLHHPFARDWRTVKSVKVAFEDRYTIQVQFPRRGDPTAISYSDEGRSQPVSKRFAALLKEHLHVDVTSKARRGTRLPKVEPRRALRRYSEAWWNAALAPSTDNPEEWLEEAVADLMDDQLVRAHRVRFFACNSPHIDRRANPVDSLDCDGEVVLPWDLRERDDPTQLEDDGGVQCSTVGHRWRPARYGLPSRARLLVEIDHGKAFARLHAELARYGDVAAAPRRPGVLSLRLPDMFVELIYVPLVTDSGELDPNVHSQRTLPVWVSAPGEAPPSLPETTLGLATVLADIDCLARAWGTTAWVRRRKPASTDAPMLAADSAVGGKPSTRVLKLRHAGVFLDDQLEELVGPRHKAMLVLDALRQAAAQHEADGTGRFYSDWSELDDLLNPDDRAPGDDVKRKAAWHRWVSRTRSALSKRSGDPTLGDRVVLSKGSKYRLGDGFVVIDERLQAAEND